MYPLTEREIKKLRLSESISFRYLGPGFILLTAVAFLVVALFNLQYCARLAALEDASIGDVISNWVQGVDLSASYSGVAIAAQGRLISSISQIAVAVISIVFAIVAIVTNERNRRIYRFIESIKK